MRVDLLDNFKINLKINKQNKFNKVKLNYKYLFLLLLNALKIFEINEINYCKFFKG